MISTYNSAYGPRSELLFQHQEEILGDYQQKNLELFAHNDFFKRILENLRPRFNSRFNFNSISDPPSFSEFLERSITYFLSVLISLERRKKTRLLAGIENLGDVSPKTYKHLALFHLQLLEIFLLLIICVITLG